MTPRGGSGLEKRGQRGEFSVPYLDKTLTSNGCGEKGMHGGYSNDFQVPGLDMDIHQDEQTQKRWNFVKKTP